MSLVPVPLVSSFTVAVRPKDTATGKYVIVDSVATGNDVQQVSLSGPTASGNLTLTFGGDTTGNIAFTATAPTVYAMFGSMPVVSGAATQIAIPVVPSPGFYTPILRWEIIDGGFVTLAGTFDLGAVGGGDFTLSNPSGGGTCNFTILVPAYVPTSTSLAVRFTSADSGGLFWDIDALSVVQAGHGSAVYDDADGTHFTSAGQRSIAGTGSDNRFYDGGFTRFQGGSQAGMVYAIDPAAMQSALRALASIGSGNCVCTASDGSNHTPLTVEFTGTLGAESQAGITSATSGVTFPSHVVGGFVPSITITPSGGSPGSPIPLRGLWICEVGGMKGAVYDLSQNSITPLSTDTVSVAVPAGWMVTESGALPAGTATADNRVGGNLLPAFVPGPKTLGAGYNLLAEGYFMEGIQFSDMMCRTTPFPLGFWSFGGTLAVDANLYPTFISPNGSTEIVTQPPGSALANNPKGPLNAPNGVYTFICTDPGHAWITPGGDGPTGTSVSTVGGHADTTVGDVRTLYRNIQADQSLSRAPKFTISWNASGAETTFNGNPALPVTVTNLKIYPPDPSDPTGMTPWASPTQFHPAHLARIAGAKTLRFDQSFFYPNPGNSYADFADIRTTAQRGRYDVIRDPIIPVASCAQYTGSAVDAPLVRQILITTSVPHTLYSGAFVQLNGCGNATFGDGSNFDIDIHTGLGFGVITMLSSTTFVWHAGRQASTSAATMTNSTTGGSVHAGVGTGMTINDAVDMCNYAGATLHFNVSVAATDACIDAIADAVYARLNPGLKALFELGDECWNGGYATYSWMVVRAFQIYGFTNGDPTPATVWHQNNINVRVLARATLAGRAADVIFVMPSQAANPGLTEAILDLCASPPEGGAPHRVDEILFAPYLNNVGLVVPQSVAAAASQGVTADVMDIWIDSNTNTAASLHNAKIAASAYPSARLRIYEGGWEEELIGISGVGAGNANTTDYPNLYRDAHAMHRSPRRYWQVLNHLQHSQDDGVTAINFFYLTGGGGLESYSKFEWYGSPLGTGNPAENPDPEALDSIVSQEGGAISYWNSQVGASPTAQGGTYTFRTANGRRYTFRTVAAVSSPTTVAVSGSPSITVGTPATFTYTLNHPVVSGTVSIVPAVTGFSSGTTFGTNPIVITAGNSSGTTTVNAGTAASGTVTGTSTPTLAFTPVSVTASAPGSASLLQSSDFAYLGKYTFYGQQDGIFSALGLTHRFVGGNIQFLTMGYRGSQSDGYGLNTLTPPGSFGSAMTEALVADRPTLFGPYTLDPVGHGGLWFEDSGLGNGSGRLWCSQAQDYPPSGASQDITRSLTVRDLSPTLGVSNIHGCYGLEGIGQRCMIGNVQPIPDAFRTATGLGSKKYLVGFGGYTSLFEQGSVASLGLMAAAIPEPTGYSDSDETIIPAADFKLIADHRDGGGDWYGSGHPTTADRGVRMAGSPAMVNYYDGGFSGTGRPTGAPTSGAQWLGAAPDGNYRMTWGDTYAGTGIWIDTASRYGFLAINTGAIGFAYYASSQLNSDGLGYQLHCFDPADFASAIAGTKQPFEVQPSWMRDLTSEVAPYQPTPYFGSPFGCTGATFDAVNKVLYMLIVNINNGYPCEMHAYSVNC